MAEESSENDSRTSWKRKSGWDVSEMIQPDIMGGSIMAEDIPRSCIREIWIQKYDSWRGSICEIRIQEYGCWTPKKNCTGYAGLRDDGRTDQYNNLRHVMPQVRIDMRV